MSGKMTSTRLMVGVLALLSLGMACNAGAQGYPSRSIRLVVPLAGGGSDLAARAVAVPLGEALGQPVVVENRPGAGGVLGVDMVAKAPPDGYTFLMGSSTTMAANLFLYQNIPFDPVKDFVPLAMLGTIDFALVVPPVSQAKSVRDLIAMAKAKPGQLNYGFGSSAALLCGELFKGAAGIDITKVPYKASPQAITDVMTDRLQLLCEPLVSTLPHIKAGTLRIIGMTSPKRSSLVPDVPTLIESGVPLEFATWAAFFAPANAPAEALGKLRVALLKVLTAPGMDQVIQRTGFVPTPAGAEELGAIQKAEIARISKVVKDAGIKAE